MPTRVATKRGLGAWTIGFRWTGGRELSSGALLNCLVPWRPWELRLDILDREAGGEYGVGTNTGVAEILGSSGKP